MGSWLDNAIFYEVYPQSFKDTNADGIGDLPGIIEKLDYIRELGCNALWLNPCFDSPLQDAGYDISDYYTVHPRYGTNTDLRRLFREAHRRDMHVILDLVPGHTSDQHPWFRASCRGEENPYTKRYVWTQDKTQCFDLKRPGGDQSSNIRSFILGVGERDGLCAVNYYTCQPCLNYGFEVVSAPYQSGTDSPEAIATREAIQDVMRFWLRMGCDGFRVDMAGSLVKNDPDGMGNVKLWQKFRAFLDAEFPQAVMISEWGRPDLSLLAGFHMDFLLHNGPSHYLDLFRVERPYFSRSGGDFSEFLAVYRRNLELTAGKGLICIPTGDHDMVRMAGKLDQEELKIAYAFLLTMPGAPFLYYGDEIGMRWVEGLTSKEGSRSLRAGSRTPMQWDDDVNDGFSDARPDKLYLPLDPDPHRPRVRAQMETEGSLWREVRRLIRLRLNNEPLQSGARVEFLFAEKNAYPLVYRRTGETGSVLVVLNPLGQDVECTCSLPELGEVLYSNHGAAAVRDGRLSVPRASATIFRCATGGI